MTQVADILRDALGYLRVIDAHEALNADEARDAIKALNKMMRGMEAEGTALGWVDVVKPDDTMPTPPETDEAIGVNLALRLRSRYGVALDADVMALARNGLAMLNARQVRNTYARLEYPDLPRRYRGDFYE